MRVFVWLYISIYTIYILILFWAKCLTITYIYIYSYTRKIIVFLSYLKRVRKECVLLLLLLLYTTAYCYTVMFILNLNRYSTQNNILFRLWRIRLLCVALLCCILVYLSHILFYSNSSMCIYFILFKFYSVGLPKNYIYLLSFCSPTLNALIYTEKVIWH